jgi:hypothetical protein
MRIERVVIENCGGVSGTFRFPSRGLALGAAPNEGGKTVLTAAIAAALYGESALRPFAALSPSHPACPGDSTWVMLHLALDSGESLVVARDLGAGSVQVTDSAGTDVTARYRGATESQELGEVMLGLTREEFEDTVIVNLQNLRGVFGNPHLVALLERGEEDARGESAPTEDADGESPRAESGAGNPDAESFGVGSTAGGTASRGSTPPVSREPIPESDEDFRIVRSPSVEFGMLSDEKVSETFGDDASADEAAVPDASDDDSGAAESAPPLEGPAAELHRLKSERNRLEGEFERKSEELRRHSERTQELQAYLDRVGAITSSEPHDVERLGQLVELMRKTQEKERQREGDEKEFRRKIDEKGLRAERLEELERVFTGLDPADREFLDGYRQGDTIRRGNHALVKSESRLDETRLTEITSARDKGTRLAVAPLLVAAAAFGGRLVLQFLPVSFLDPQAFLLLGILMVVVGLTIFARAKNLHEKERRTLLESHEQKRTQLAAFEKEERHIAGRLAAVSEAHGIADPQELLTSFEEWIEHRTEARTLASFAKRHRELEEEAGTLREKLGSFAPTENGGASTLSSGLGDWEALYQEYRQTSEAREEIASADETAAHFESELADLESERAAVTDAIADLLLSVGLDADKDPDEAIEILALRGRSFSVTHPSDADSAAETDEIDLMPRRDPSQPAFWQAPLSARIEAIARRFLPNIRGVEIDSCLCPRLRLTADGPELELSELTARLSAASLDQLCLALRLAIVENLSSHGETLPVLLDDPLVRADDARHDRALEFLVEDASHRYQVVLLTCHEVRARWFLHQYPKLREAVSSITSQDEAEGGAPSATLAWAALASPS